MVGASTAEHIHPVVRRGRLDPTRSLVLLILANSALSPSWSKKPIRRLLARRFSPHLSTPLFPESSDSTKLAYPKVVDLSGVIGFWEIADVQAADDVIHNTDSLPDLRRAAEDAMRSQFTAVIVLRADGLTSRNSNFPGGTWSLVQQETRTKLIIEQESKRLRQKWVYEGFIGKRQSTEKQSNPFEESRKLPELKQPSRNQSYDNTTLSPELLKVRKDIAAIRASNEFNYPSRPRTTSILQICGDAVLWDMTNPENPVRIRDAATFFMQKRQVDLNAIHATTKPRTTESDPEDLRLQSEINKLIEEDDEIQLKTLISDIRKLKETHGDSWQEAVEEKAQRHQAGVNLDDSHEDQSGGAID